MNYTKNATSRWSGTLRVEIGNIDAASRFGSSRIMIANSSNDISCAMKRTPVGDSDSDSDSDSIQRQYPRSKKEIKANRYSFQRKEGAAKPY